MHTNKTTHETQTCKTNANEAVQANQCKQTSADETMHTYANICKPHLAKDEANQYVPGNNEATNAHLHYCCRSDLLLRT